MLEVFLECVRMSSCPRHTDQTNPNKTVDLKNNFKLESEEDIYCNLERLRVLLCLKVARCSSNTQETSPSSKLHQTLTIMDWPCQIGPNMSKQTIPNKDRQPRHTEQTSVFVWKVFESPFYSVLLYAVYLSNI